MTLLRRLSTTLSAKANELLDRFDDPGEALDYAYQLLLEQFEGARQASVHLATARQQLVLRAVQLEARAAELDAQAHEAAEAGRDELAREALARRNVISSGVASLESESDELSDEEQLFTQATRLLESEVEILGVQKDAVKASYAVTRDKAEINEAVSKILDVADVGVTVRRAEDKSAQLRAQSNRIDALLASRALLDLTSSPGVIGTELHEARRSEDVERELGKIKRARRDC